MISFAQLSDPSTWNLHALGSPLAPFFRGLEGGTGQGHEREGSTSRLEATQLLSLLSRSREARRKGGPAEQGRNTASGYTDACSSQGTRWRARCIRASSRAGAPWSVVSWACWCLLASLSLWVRRSPCISSVSSAGCVQVAGSTRRGARLHRRPLCSRNGSRNSRNGSRSEPSPPPLHPATPRLTRPADC